MRYPTGLENIIRTATLTATNIVASSAFELVERDAAGGGNVELGGSYTGADDALFDIEILSDTINGAPTISAPVYSGIGNGRISGIAATGGISAQEFSVTVLDLGTPTRAAWAPFQGGALRAKATGTGGNALSVVISQAGMTATATDYAVTVELSQDGSEFTGEQFNFGALTLEPEGTVPVAAARLRFGDDVSVYRHWRTYRDGRYRYHFSPALRQAVPVGTRVYAITGGRTVEILDGASVEETYTDITTLYSLLSQIRDDSALIEFDGVIANDRRPGGMACDDLSVFTGSYVNGSVRGGTSFIRRALIPLTVSDSAPTETLRAECLAAPVAGAEIWGVVASVSGALTSVVTGEAFSDAGYEFTIPIELPPGATPDGDRSAFLELATRSDSESIPTLCVRNFVLGAEARPNTYTFEWRPHPGAACDCRSEPIQGGPNDNLLGIDPPEGGAMATLPAALKSRVETIDAWRLMQLNNNAGFVASVAGSVATSGSSGDYTNEFDGAYSIVNQVVEAVSASLVYDAADVDAVFLAATMLQDALYDIYESSGNALPSAAGTAFDSALVDVFAMFSPLIGVGTGGSNGWERLINAAVQTVVGNPGSSSNAITSTGLVTASQAGAKNISADMSIIRKMMIPHIIPVYTAADLKHPFDSATRKGNDVWQDYGGTHWFASLDGLLPIQPGHYYHSARMEIDPDTGEETPVATREYGIGVAIGCIELLKVGDRLIIKTGPYSNARGTYQAGDYIEWEIVRADPVELGGGQTGDDTITFGVRGTNVGALADYLLVTTAPTSYSNSGISFSIAPGAIDFQVGDGWTFSAEGGEFRWRVDGGSWTTDDIAGTVTLASGVSALFRAGATPSFIDGDAWSIKALASNGVGRARAPDDESMSWTGSTQIDVTPSGSGIADTLVIAAHTIPSTATVTLSGSNDNWATTAYSHAVPWSAGTMALLFASTTCAKWRLAVNDSGSINWLYLGVPVRPIVAGGGTLVEHGNWQRRIRMSNGVRTRGLGGTVAHSEVSQDSVDDLLAALEYAHANDDGRIGAVSPEGEAGICTVPQDIDITDIFGHQPADAYRRLAFQMQLTPI